MDLLKLDEHLVPLIDPNFSNFAAKIDTSLPQPQLKQPRLAAAFVKLQRILADSEEKKKTEKKPVNAK